MLAQADVLIGAFRSAAPGAQLGICLTPPPNSREEAFQANYKDRYHRWGWKRIQHRLVQREIAHFAGREAENLFLIPTELGVDPIDGYPTNNGVHPNEFGYKQIGATIYAWFCILVACLFWAEVSDAPESRMRQTLRYETGATTNLALLGLFAIAIRVIL
jgi:hypothetical protein